MIRVITLMLVGAVVGAGSVLWLLGGEDVVEPPSARMLAPSGEAGQPVPLPQAAVARADADPAAALDEALRLSDRTAQRRMVERIAALWTARDPLGALAAAEQLPGRLRMAFRSVIDGEWARLDTTGYLAFIETNPEYLEALTGIDVWSAETLPERAAGIRTLLASDPLLVMNLADDLSSRLGAILRTLALSAYAESDPFAAIALAERMPRGQKRDEALASVAAGYALADPEGALVWARSLSPQPANVLSSVLRSIAQNDIVHAVELALQPASSANEQSAAGGVIEIATEDSAQAALAADRLLLADAVGRKELLSRLLTRWIERDSASLFGWVRANAARVDADILSSVAYAFASRDPAIAARSTDLVPLSLRETWIARAAQGYATADPLVALDWISQYEGQAGYEVGMRLVLGNYSRVDPVAAAGVLDAASVDVQLASAGTVADIWARQDPVRAAEWAGGLSNPRVRASAVPEAVGRWSAQSAQAAEDWALELPPGDDRDAALYALLRGRALTDRPRPTYSTNATATLIERIGSLEIRGEVEAWFEEDTRLR